MAPWLEHDTPQGPWAAFRFMWMVADRAETPRRPGDTSLARYQLQTRHWRRYIAAVLVLVVATLGGYLVAQTQATDDLAEQRDALAEDGEVLIDTIALTFSGVESRMNAVAGLFRSSDTVTVAEFERFTADIGLIPGMRGYGYAMFMDDDQIAAWNVGDDAPQYGSESFDPDVAVDIDRLLSPQHAIVVYFVGKDPADRPEGLDLMSEPRRSAAVTRSVSSQSIAVTSFLQLLDETDDDGMVAFLPIRSPVGKTVVTGLVAVPIDLSYLLTGALPPGSATEIAWQIIDQESSGVVGRRHPDDDRVWADEVQFGDRRWTVTVTSLEASQAGELSAAILTAGVIGGLLGGFGVLVLAAALDHWRARRDLEAALQVKNRFIATVSHELRTPLAGVVGFLHAALDEGAADESERAELVTLAAGQADEMVAIIEDLLTAAKAEVTDLAVRSEPTDLDVEIAAVVRSLTDEVVLDLAPTLDRVWADPARLRQVLRNLIKNAHRHGVPPVTVRTVTASDIVEVHVMDRGPGVPGDRVDRLFRPFEPLDDGATKPHSLGLGLWISQRLIQLMGGDLTYRVYPTPTFVIQLRRARVAEPVAVTAPV